jgi:hypothetical protein
MGLIANRAPRAFVIRPFAGRASILIATLQPADRACPTFVTSSVATRAPPRLTVTFPAPRATVQIGIIQFATRAVSPFITLFIATRAFFEFSTGAVAHPPVWVTSVFLLFNTGI